MNPEKKKVFLTRVKYKVDLVVADRYLDEHRTFLESCVKAGYIIASGGVQPRTGGFILSKHASLEEATQVLHQDPFFLKDIADYDILEWEPNRGMPDFFKCLN